MPVPHQTGWVPSGDVSIHYRKLGAENRGQTPILIVHGLSYFSYDWLEVGEVLAAEREVVAMDMRGFGDSDWSPQKDYSVPTMAQDIVNVLDHLGWKRALLAGERAGGLQARDADRGQHARQVCLDRARHEVFLAKQPRALRELSHPRFQAEARSVFPRSIPPA